jgi:hypothetical protein
MNADELGNDFDDSSRAGREGSDETDPVRAGGRATRSRGARPAAHGSNLRKRKHIDGYNSIDEMSEEDGASGDDWDSDKNDEDEHMPDALAVSDAQDASEAEEDSDDDEDVDDDAGSRSLIVTLKLKNKSLAPSKDTPPTSPPPPRQEASNGVVRQPPSTSAAPESVDQSIDATKAGASSPENPHVVVPITSDTSDVKVEEQLPAPSTNGISPEQQPLQQVVGLQEF